MQRFKIAIVGTGITGLGAAHALHANHDITVYEKAGRPGGHANTVDIDYNGTAISVDTGFIVFNGRNYPLLTDLFETHAIPVETTDMSFGVSLRDGALEWSGHSLAHVFAQWRNAVSPRFLGMLRDITRFYKRAQADLATGALEGLSLGDYVARLGLGRGFAQDFISPMGAAIWSMPRAHVFDFPAQSFVRFFANHRLLGFERPQWNTVTGGSRTYVTRVVASFADRLRLDCGVRGLDRHPDGVTVHDTRGGAERFDHVLLACHSDEALDLLRDADEDERAILGAIRYAPNEAWLHKDTTLMPRRRRAWAAWSVLESAPDAPVSVSYWMNALQNIDPARPLFVTLNPARAPRPEDTFGLYTYDHPQYDGAAIEAQGRLGTIQGRRRTWFAGAWAGYGFHEDGLRAGLDAAQDLNRIAQGHAP